MRKNYSLAKRLSERDTLGTHNLVLTCDRKKKLEQSGLLRDFDALRTLISIFASTGLAWRPIHQRVALEES